MESDFQESVPVRDPVSGIVLNGEDAAFDTFRSMFKIGKMYAGKIAATVGIDLSVAVRQGAEGIQRVETVGFLLLVGEIFPFAACGAAAVLKHNAESAFERGIMPVTSFLINRFDALVRTPEENQRDFFPVGGADDKRIKLYAIAHGHHLFFNDEVDGGLHAIAAIGCELHDKLLYFSENERTIF